MRHAPVAPHPMLGILIGLLVALAGTVGVAPPASAQSAQDVCAFANNNLPLGEAVATTLCEDFTAGIERGHIRPSRALGLLRAVAERAPNASPATTERVLTTISATVNPAKGDLPAELLISRTFELFGRIDDPQRAMALAAQEVAALRQALGGVAQVYRSIGLDLAPDQAQRELETSSGTVILTVSRLDTAITATALALDRFERRLDRSLNDTAGMQQAVLEALNRPSFAGAEPLPEALVRYIGNRTNGRQWRPIVRSLAQARDRNG